MSRFEKVKIFLMGMAVALLIAHLVPQRSVEAQVGVTEPQNGRYQISATTVPAKGATTPCAYIVDTRTGQYYFTTKQAGTFGN